MTEPEAVETEEVPAQELSPDLMRALFQRDFVSTLVLQNFNIQVADGTNPQTGEPVKVMMFECPKDGLLVQVPIPLANASSLGLELQGKGIKVASPGDLSNLPQGGRARPR